MTDWLTTLIGRPKDLSDAADPVNMAENYVLRRDMNRGRSTTFAKAQRAQRIAGGLRGIPTTGKDAKRAKMKAALVDRVMREAREVPFLPQRPHLLRKVTIVQITDEKTGEKVGAPFRYLHTSDNSRYTGERLREIRRNRKWR